MPGLAVLLGIPPLLARGTGVLVVHVLGPALGPTADQARLPAGQHCEAVDTGDKQGHDGDI